MSKTTLLMPQRNHLFKSLFKSSFVGKRVIVIQMGYSNGQEIEKEIVQQRIEKERSLHTQITPVEKSVGIKLFKVLYDSDIDGKGIRRYKDKINRQIKQPKRYDFPKGFGDFV